MRSHRLAHLGLALAAAFAVIALGAPAAQAQQRAAAPVTLVFQAWDPTAVTDQFIKVCERKLPNIQVKTEPVAGNYVTKSSFQNLDQR